MTKRPSQFRLLTERRFLPFFAAQSLGAFNDNIFRNLLVILVTYGIVGGLGLDAKVLTNLAGGVFVLPYLLFSGLAGQLADRFDKALVVKLTKASEIPIMTIAVLGLVANDLVWLLIALFLLGTHSTFFAPAKYGLLPQVVREQEIVGGNALVELGTFLAILLGTLLAGVLIATGELVVANATLLVVAVGGFLAALAMPRLPPVAPGLQIDWNPWRSMWSSVKVARESRTVFLSLLGNSWFWFYGALMLAQIPLFVRGDLGGSEQVVTVLLVTFSSGVGIGSLLCERLSGGKVEIGLVPLGSIGLTVFALDLAFAVPDAPAVVPLTAEAFLSHGYAWRIAIDFALLGMFGGFFIVPLYAMIQERTRREVLSRVISANNILNAVFMAAAAVFGAIALGNGLTVPQLFVAVAAMNAAVALFIYSLVPEFLLRFLAWLLIHTIYRLRVDGLESIPARGAALLTCNHVSFVDALVISAASRRPVRFIMEAAIFRNPVLNVIFRGMKAIPVTSAREDRETYERAFEIVRRELEEGQLVCIFPEGKLTRDGAIDEFRGGIMKILAATPVPVIPLAVSGLWGSTFSRFEPRLWRRYPRRLLARIRLTAGKAIPPGDVTPEGLRQRIAELRGATP